MIFKYTSTIGQRYFDVNKRELERTIEEVETEYGQLKAKVTTLPDGTKKN